MLLILLITIGTATGKILVAPSGDRAYEPNIAPPQRFMVNDYAFICLKTDPMTNIYICRWWFAPAVMAQ